MKPTDYLRSVYDNAGLGGQDDWLGRHECVFVSATSLELSLAGSMALHVGHKNPMELPSDIDFVTSDWDTAWTFVNQLVTRLRNYKSWCKVLINNGTDFVPDDAIAHIRIHSSMWLPICIFIIPPERDLFWYACWRLKVQAYDEVTRSKEKLDEKRKNNNKPDREDDEEEDGQEEHEEPDHHADHIVVITPVHTDPNEEEKYTKENK